MDEANLLRRGLPQRFVTKICETETGCYEWLAARNSSGYGVFKQAGGMRLAHRIAWTVLMGPIAPGLVLDHICFNRACVNTAHLRVVTWKQNREYLQGASRISKSRCRGVFWRESRQRYVVTVRHNGKHHHGGSYRSLSEADAAAKALRRRLYTNHNDGVSDD